MTGAPYSVTNTTMSAGSSPARSSPSPRSRPARLIRPTRPITIRRVNSLATVLLHQYQGQSYTGEEEDFDANGALSGVLLTGIADQAYSSLKLDYSVGAYEGYQAYYTGMGQSFTSEEVDVSAANQLEKVVYSGMTSTPYSSVEQDYSGGTLADEFTISPTSRANPITPIRSRTTPAALRFRRRSISIAAAMI